MEFGIAHKYFDYVGAVTRRKTLWLVLMAGILSKTDLQGITMESLRRSHETMVSDTPHMHLNCPVRLPLQVVLWKQ